MLAQFLYLAALSASSVKQSMAELVKSICKRTALNPNPLNPEPLNSKP